MENNILSAASLGFICLILVLVVLFLNGLSKAALRAGYSQARTQKVTLATLISMLLWVAFLGILSWQGFFLKFESLPPRFLLAILPPLGAIIFFSFNKGFNRLIKATPMHWIIGLQAFRILMELILWDLFRHGIIPVQMSMEGRNLDILSGILAIPVAWLAYRQVKGSHYMVFAYNLLGLALLFNIVIVSTLSTPAPFRLFMQEPANTIIAYLPFIWLPGFVVPAAFALHAFSLKKLYLNAARQPEPLNNLAGS